MALFAICDRSCNTKKCDDVTMHHNHHHYISRFWNHHHHYPKCNHHHHNNVPLLAICDRNCNSTDVITSGCILLIIIIFSFLHCHHHHHHYLGRHHPHRHHCQPSVTEVVLLTDKKCDDVTLAAQLLSTFTSYFGRKKKTLRKIQQKKI